MFNRSHMLGWILCLAGLLGCGSGCTTHASQAPRRVEQSLEVWNAAAGEPVLVEDRP
jgi:hypothetical protein